jgi:hypothetical protein
MILSINWCHTHTVWEKFQLSHTNLNRLDFCWNSMGRMDHLVEFALNQERRGSKKDAGPFDGDLRRCSSHSTDKSFESDSEHDDEDRPIFADYAHHQQHLNYKPAPEINSELSSTLPPLPPRLKRSVSRSSPDSELLGSVSSSKKDKLDHSSTSTSTLSAISHTSSSISSVRITNSPAATSASTISSSQAISAGTNDHDDNLHHHCDANETHPCPPYAPCCSEGDGGGSPKLRLRQRREERIKKTQTTIDRIKSEMKRSEESARSRSRAIQRLKKWGLITVGLAFLVGASYAICSNFFSQDVILDQVLVDKRTAGS